MRVDQSNFVARIARAFWHPTGNVGCGILAAHNSLHLKRSRRTSLSNRRRSTKRDSRNSIPVLDFRTGVWASVVLKVDSSERR